MNDRHSPVVLLHGFGQNGRCWGPLLPALEQEREVSALDLPGHGRAGAIEADLWTTADLVAGGIAEGEPAVVIGYSMGGRVALHVALAHPAHVAALVLISATGGIDDEAERTARRSADDALAHRIEWLGVPAFVDEWLAQPMFAGLDEDSRYVEERRFNTVAGLGSSLRLAGAGAQEPLWDRLGDLQMPVLVIAGALDAKFSALAERLAATIGDNARLAVVGDAGHTVHLEQPEATTDLITTWLGNG